MNFGGTAVSLIALTVALVVMWRHNWEGSRFIVILMLLAGFGITAAGWVGDLLAQGGQMIGTAIGQGTAQAFGVGVPALVVVLMITWVAVDMKDKKIHVATPWVALALPTVLAVVGGVYLGVGDTVLDAIGTGLSHFAGWLGSLG